MSPFRLPRLGLRREVLILLPIAVLVLVLLSTISLFSHRSAILRLAEERRSEAARLARYAAEELERRPAVAEAALRRLVPQASAMALLDENGKPQITVGIPPEGGFTSAGNPSELDQAVGLGPDAEHPDSVVGLAPLVSQGHRLSVRVDLPAAVLGGELRSLQRLTPLILGINGGLALLLLLFLRHLLAPFESLLARARDAGEPQPSGEDETAFLLSTFDRALAALVTPLTDDLTALERVLTPHVESGLLLLDPEGKLLAINPVGAQLLDLEAPAPGVPLRDLLTAHPELRALLESAVAENRPIPHGECRIEAGGREVALGLTLHAVGRREGRPRGFLVLFADSTAYARRVAETHLAESLAQLGELAAGVAHELRNSLATLRGYLTLLAREDEAEARNDYLEEIRRETEHLQRVLDDFLAFARPGTARLEEIDLAEVTRLAAADPALSGIEISLDAPSAGLPRLRGDSQLLERALRNLLHNAAQAERAAGRKGPIELRLRKADEGIEIEIEDRGPGLPAAVRERLFHPFVSGRPGGTGLGLALAHRIVTLHGGRVQIEDREGGGTRVRLQFNPGKIATDLHEPVVNELPDSHPLPGSK